MTFAAWVIRKEGENTNGLFHPSLLPIRPRTYNFFQFSASRNDENFFFLLLLFHFISFVYRFIINSPCLNNKRRWINRLEKKNGYFFKSVARTNSLNEYIHVSLYESIKRKYFFVLVFEKFKIVSYVFLKRDKFTGDLSHHLTKWIPITSSTKLYERNRNKIKKTSIIRVFSKFFGVIFIIFEII